MMEEATANQIVIIADTNKKSGGAHKTSQTKFEKLASHHNGKVIIKDNYNSKESDHFQMYKGGDGGSSTIHINSTGNQKSHKKSANKKQPHHSALQSQFHSLKSKIENQHSSNKKQLNEEDILATDKCLNDYLENAQNGVITDPKTMASPKINEINNEQIGGTLSPRTKQSIFAKRKKESISQLAHQSANANDRVLNKNSSKLQEGQTPTPITTTIRNQKTREDFYKNINLLTAVTTTSIMQKPSSQSRSSSIMRKKNMKPHINYEMTYGGGGGSSLGTGQVLSRDHQQAQAQSLVSDKMSKRMLSSDVYRIYVQGEVPFVPPLVQLAQLDQQVDSKQKQPLNSKRSQKNVNNPKTNHSRISSLIDQKQVSPGIQGYQNPADFLNMSQNVKETVPLEAIKNLSLTADKIFCSKDSLVNRDSSLPIIEMGGKYDSRFRRSSSQFLDSNIIIQQDKKVNESPNNQESNQVSIIPKLSNIKESKNSTEDNNQQIIRKSFQQTAGLIFPQYSYQGVMAVPNLIHQIQLPLPQTQVIQHSGLKKKQIKSSEKQSAIRKSGGMIKKNKNEGFEDDNIEEQLRMSKGPHFLLVGGGSTSGNQSSVIQDPVTSAKSTTRGGGLIEESQIKALRESRVLNETQQPTRISHDFTPGGNNPKTLNPVAQTRLNWSINQSDYRAMGQVSPQIFEQGSTQKPFDLSLLRDEYQKMVSSRFGVPKPLNMQDYLERQEMIKKINKEKRARWQSLNNIEPSDKKKKTQTMPKILKDRSESRQELGALVEEKFQQLYRPDFSKICVQSLKDSKLAPQKGIKQILNPLRPQGQIMCFLPPLQQHYTPHIPILNKPFIHLRNHPINVIIRQINLFCNQLTFATRPLPLPGSQPFAKPGSQQPSADLHLIQQLARLFNIDLPKNQLTNQNFLKSRVFILQVKESMLKRLFTAINETNGGLIDYSQARAAFQASGGGYKVYVGSGNNAQMIVQQIYKEQRWWWNVQVQWSQGGGAVEYEESEEADEDEMQAKQNEKQNANSVANEDFKEQNLIWTQWKKYSLFNQLKQVAQTPSTASSEDQSKGPQELTLADWDTFLQGGDISKARINPSYVSSTDVRLYAKLENNFHLSNKCSLFYNMRRYYEALDRDPFEVIPLTFHIKKGCSNDDQEYQKFLAKFKEFENLRNLQTISSPKASKTEASQKSGQKMIRIRHQKNKISVQQGQKTFYQHNQINGQRITTQVLFDEELQTEPGSLSKRKLKLGEGVFSSPKIASQYSKLNSFAEPTTSRGNTQILQPLDQSPRNNNNHGALTASPSKDDDHGDEAQQQNSGMKNLRALRTISGLQRKEESQTKLPAIPSAQGLTNNSQIQGFQKHKTTVGNDEIDEEIQKGASEQRIHNIWIIKPGENTNRGNGIKVCSSLSEIKEILNANMYEYHKRTFIVQKYIERPQLYQNRKFDIRCYGMLTSVNGHLKGFFYDPDQFSRECGGYLRTSSREYNVAAGKLKNQFIHLTNDAVQKKADDYGKHEIGNKISFREYQQYLNERVPELGIDFQRDIFSSQIKRIITDTFRATCLQIDPNKRHHSFEIFGYDFMLDEDFKVQLIEVNTNPCIETAQCPILQRIITDMVDSGFRIAVDPLFPPPSYSKRMNQSLPFTHWELVFDGDIDGPEIERLLNPDKTKTTNATTVVANSNLSVIKE